MKKIIMILILLNISACAFIAGEETSVGFVKHRPLFLRNIPDGDDAFGRGFRDGCYNFIGQNGHGTHRFFDRPAYVKDGLDEELYLEGYKSGDRYCGVYVNKDIIL